MKRFLQLQSALLFLVILSCNDGEQTSSYSELLSQPPYASLTDSIKENRNNADLYFRRGKLLRENTLSEPALEDFKKAWSLKNDERYAAYISNMLLENKPDSAIIFINDALKKIPNSIFLSLDLAKAYNAIGKKDESLAVCNNIIQKEPGQIDALLLKSDLLQEKNDSTGSLSALETAYSLAPFDPELTHSLAFKYAQNKNVKALAICDSLLKKDTGGVQAEPYYFKGVYYYNTNEKDKAISFFNHAIQHDYNFLDAYLDKGRTLFEQKKTAEALKVFTLASTISPAFADAYYWMGKCQQALGQTIEAKENYRRAYGFDKTLTEAKDSADKIR